MDVSKLTAIGTIKYNTASEWVRLPTGEETSRKRVLRWCDDDDERRIAERHSWNIDIRTTQDERNDIHSLVNHIIRDKNCFRAMLIESRGLHPSNDCHGTCSDPGISGKFRHCMRIADYEDGVCSNCLWESRKDECGQPDNNESSSDEAMDEDSSEEDDGGDDEDASEEGDATPADQEIIDLTSD